jgi:hypothetical protein
VATAAVPDDIPTGLDARRITIGLSDDDTGRMSVVTP